MRLSYGCETPCFTSLFSVDRHAKVLEALTFCSEIRNCERFVPILQGLSIGDVQMKVCAVILILLLLVCLLWFACGLVCLSVGRIMQRLHMHFVEIFGMVCPWIENSKIFHCLYLDPNR